MLEAQRSKLEFKVKSSKVKGKTWKSSRCLFKINSESISGGIWSAVNGLINNKFR